jgi:hypothetical protein
MAVANTLAYYNMAEITAVICFIVKVQVYKANVFSTVVIGAVLRSFSQLPSRPGGLNKDTAMARWSCINMIFSSLTNLDI